jgi:pyridoxal phosphate enzyme (YggS family)
VFEGIDEMASSMTQYVNAVKEPPYNRILLSNVIINKMRKSCEESERTDVINNHPTQQQDHLAANLARVRAAIAAAAQRASRDPQDITLVAVSKTHPVELVKIAYNLGVTDFGENRVQEALPKITDFHPQDMRWHMIGHLQSNKAGKVVSSFDCVQSVDSLHLAQMLQRHTAEQNRRLPILLEVNVAGEESKSGLMPDETATVAHQIATLSHLEIQGLMTVAPQVSELEQVRPVFRTLRTLRDRLQYEIPTCSWHHLSMGMTDDYSVAIEEGATIVRIGRAIFGERPYI